MAAPPLAAFWSTRRPDSDQPASQFHGYGRKDLSGRSRGSRLALLYFGIRLAFLKHAPFERPFENARPSRAASDGDLSSPAVRADDEQLLKALNKFIGIM